MRDFPIILMTGFELSQKEIATMQFKADAYVTKPFSMDYIVRMVETLRRK
jgi:DNA-binding response OmpR family regulator